VSEGISKSNEKTRESRRLAGRTERKNNSVIDRLDSGRLVDNGMHQCRYSRGGCHQTAEALAAPIIEVRNMDPLKEAPAPWQIEVSEEL
jgi:hypothetical protein